MDKEKIKKFLENMDMGEIDEDDNEKSVSFKSDVLMLHFWKNKKHATLNLWTQLYPDEASKITVEICGLLTDHSDKTLKIGKIYTLDENNKKYLFGEKALEYLEKENEEFINYRVDNLKNLDYILESGHGFDC